MKSHIHSRFITGAVLAAAVMAYAGLASAAAPPDMHANTIYATSQDATDHKTTAPPGAAERATSARNAGQKAMLMNVKQTPSSGAATARTLGKCHHTAYGGGFASTACQERPGSVIYVYMTSDGQSIGARTPAQPLASGILIGHHTAALRLMDPGAGQPQASVNRKNLGLGGGAI